MEYISHNGVSDLRELKILDIVYAERVTATHRRTQARLNFHERIRECAENGRVALVCSGRDCDGVVYGGDVCYVEADWRMVDERIEHDLKSADGPMSHHIERPSIAEEIEYHSRDLVAEAFENGHPHSLHADDLDDLPY